MSNSEESGDETSEQEETWETSAEESSDQEDVLQTNSVQSIVFGLSFFLNLFQLIFRVSERAIYALLDFLRILITHLSALSPTNPLLWQLSISLPKSLASIRIFIKHDSSTSEYVVCPLCCKLCNLSDCVIRCGSAEVSLKCTHIEYPNHPHHSRRQKCNTPLLKKVHVGKIMKLVP